MKTLSKKQLSEISEQLDFATRDEKRVAKEIEVAVEGLLIMIQCEVERDYEVSELLPAGGGYPAQTGYEETGKTLDIKSYECFDEDGEEVELMLDINEIENQFNK